MAIIAVASVKGGTGKTTAALSLAAAVAEITSRTASTVLLDLDPSGDATLRMGIEREGALIGALIGGRRKPGDHVGDFTLLNAAHRTPEGFSVVPSCDDIGEIEERFFQQTGGTELFIYRLHALGRESHLVIDTAPGVTTLLGRAAIAAADVLIVPVVPQPGAGLSVVNIVGIARGLGNRAQVFVVAAQVDGTGLDVQHLNEHLSVADLRVSESFPHEAEIARSVWSAGTPLRFAPQSRCAAAYRNLAHHIVGVT
jgi:cellulose biosynthesis protein BcsQ